jgi:hypothetical protein
VSDSQISLGRPLSLPAPAVSVRRFGPALRRFLLTDAASWIVPVTILLLWQGLSQSGLLPPNVISAPSEVVDAAWRLTSSGELPANLAVSAKRAAIGFAIGGSLAFAFGLLNGVSRIGEKLTDTTLQMVRNIPHLALIPLVILWFGIDEECEASSSSRSACFSRSTSTPITASARRRPPACRDGPHLRHERTGSCSPASSCPAPCRRSSSACAIRARHHVADADRRRNDRSLLGLRLHGHAGARVHAARRGRAVDPDLRAARQARRQFCASARTPTLQWHPAFQTRARSI